MSTPASASAGSLLLLEEFLAPAEMGLLWEFAMDREPDFVASEVVSDEEQSRRDHDIRRSRVLFDVADVYPLVSERVLHVLPHVLERLDLAPFGISSVELQVTASNDGEWFKAHRDAGLGAVGSRELTFVYYCHREPRAFSGGELRIYGPFGDDVQPGEAGGGQTITPLQNSIVFFPSHYLHEVMATRCPSRQFADSRLTFNGWLHR